MADRAPENGQPESKQSSSDPGLNHQQLVQLSPHATVTQLSPPQLTAPIWNGPKSPTGLRNAERSTEENLYNLLDWPPQAPDVSLSDIFKAAASMPIIGRGGTSIVYNYNGMAYKNTDEQEWGMFMKAGDCAIKPIGQVKKIMKGPTKPGIRQAGSVVTNGILMELGMPFKSREVPDEQLEATKNELISLIQRLHQEQNMIHGDIKPENFIRCQDGRIRLCDFGSARSLDGDLNLDAWEGDGGTEGFVPFNRSMFDGATPPTPECDMWALAMAIWEMYTKKSARSFYQENPDKTAEDLYREQAMVDIDLIQDQATRRLVRRMLNDGGAPLRDDTPPPESTLPPEEEKLNKDIINKGTRESSGLVEDTPDKPVTALAESEDIVENIAEDLTEPVESMLTPAAKRKEPDSDAAKHSAEAIAEPAAKRMKINNIDAHVFGIEKAISVSNEPAKLVAETPVVE
ncbi:hypothetical protein BT63DRAFT_460531 [Microthyrium microscopicum]|uniref:Protein kinase domain-containing protein n=1 Tax=Microthyrium microscopicum TaxID=703497 RepID=A0A6A6TWX4_9PEZI|nr:hypothetical protein BT63DRAFT_460531 [Microthyrium microscopicum]